MPLTQPGLTHQIGGNTAGATANISAGTYLLAGGNNVTLSQDANSVTISAGAGGLTNVRISAGTTSNLLSAVTLEDSNGISFGINGSTITATVKTDYLTNIRVSAGTTSNLLSAVTFANGNNVSFGINASIVTASTAGDTHSYFFNLAHAAGATVAPSLSVWSVQPVIIPYTLSASFKRFAVANSFAGSLAAVGTANDVTRGLTVSHTVDVVVYTMGTGASSQSLRYYTSTQATMQQRATIQAGGTGSHWSSGHTISYPISGVNSNTTISGAATSASFTMQTSQFSNFSGARFFDIPFAMSLTPGAYWCGLRSSSSLSTSGTANMSILRLTGNNIFNQAAAASVRFKELGGTAETLQRIGQGVWSTNSITSTSSIALSDMSSWGAGVGVYYDLPFQFVRLT